MKMICSAERFGNVNVIWITQNGCNGDVVSAALCKRERDHFRETLRERQRLCEDAFHFCGCDIIREAVGAEQQQIASAG